MRSVLLAVLFSVALAAAPKDVNRTVALDPKGELVLDSHKGRIEVRTWDRAEVEIRARIQSDGWGTDDDTIARTEIVIHVSPGSVRVKTEYPSFTRTLWFGGSYPEVIYDIKMPRSAGLRIKDHRSEVIVRDLAGSFDLDKHRGEVRLERLEGPVTIKSHRADVRADLVRLSGSNRIETHRGEIELTVPASSRFNLDVDLDRRSNLRSEFPVSRSRDRDGHKFRVPVNGGDGATLRLKSHRGDFVLRRS